MWGTTGSLFYKNLLSYMLSAMIIRDMVENDWPAVTEIYMQGVRSGIATFQSEAPSYKEWDASHVVPCRLVACDEGKTIAWAALSRVSNRCAYQGVAELSIYVSADQRGKKVGTQLLMALIETSEKNGFWTLESRIIADNEASLALHSRCGFRLVGRRERIGHFSDGRWADTMLMERRSLTVGV